jgi:hypothetical protein
MVAIYHAYYNFCRVHQTLRVTPAMEAGLTNHIWSLEELAELLEQKAEKAAAMKFKTWLIFFCVQATGIAAVHLGPDWSLIAGVALLLPGLLSLYTSFGIHKVILIGDVRLTLAAVAINAVAWYGVAVCVRRLKKRS